MSNNNIEFKWEKIVEDTYRVKVIGGWIVMTDGFKYRGSECMVFIKDKNHEWKIK